jgi:transposase
VFDFRLGREREGPKRFLGNFEGILQSDGYGAYDRGGRAWDRACRLLGAHARRKFFDAVKLNPKDQTTIGIGRIGLLTAVFLILTPRFFAESF